MKMNYLFTWAVVLATAFHSSAQSTSPVNAGGAILTPFKPWPVLMDSALKKTGRADTWYYYIQATSTGGIPYLNLSNATLFPDSSVKQAYALEDSGGTELGYTGLHNIGQIFDPKSFYYDNILSEYDAYCIDSIELAFKYIHQIPGTVDTLDIQFYYGDDIYKGNIINQHGEVVEPTAWIMYNKTLGIGTGAEQHFQYLLDESDTGSIDYKKQKIALNQSIPVPPGKLAAISYRFIPGYTWNQDDTIQHDWTSPEPVNKLNHFIPLVVRDTSKTYDDSYNLGLSFRTSHRPYTVQDWDGAFTSGNAWINYNEQVYCGFRVSCVTSAQKIHVLDQVKVYPNPIRSQDELNIEYRLLTPSDVSITLYDMQGRKVRSILQSILEAGDQTVRIKLADLPDGLYIYTIQTADQAYSGKISVVR